MNKTYTKYLLPLFVIVVLLPLLINMYPFMIFSPDIQYVKAKVLRILEGELYADPITGFPTFHPPYYHLFLAGFKALRIPLDYILLVVTISNVILMFLFIWRIIRRQFDSRTALLTCFLVPFIIDFMSCGNIFLPTAFYFSIPFYLAGLEQYLWPYRTKGRAKACGVLWGLAFLISPGYLFLIGLAVLFDLFVHRRFRHTMILVGMLLLMLIPFFIQAYQIYAHSLFGTSAFSFWRGIPDGAFLVTLIKNFIDPTGRDITNLWVWVALVLAVFGSFSVIRTRRDKAIRKSRIFVLLAAMAYLLTYYHYLPQYAIRIQFFLALFLTAFACHTLFELSFNRYIRVTLVAILILIGLHNHYYYILDQYDKQSRRKVEFDVARAGMSEHLGEYINPDECLLATGTTYRHYVMPYFPVHCLSAYRSGEYFQLTSAVSDRLQTDYKRMMDCNTLECLEAYCRRYRISTALIHAGPEFKLSVFQVIGRHWEQVYGDDYFRIYRKP